MKNTTIKSLLEAKLVVGAKIVIGSLYASEHFCKAGEVLTLVQGYFERDNGLYTETDTCPAVWDDDAKDFDSIYHLFGNDLEDFLDCQIIEDDAAQQFRSPDMAFCYCSNDEKHGQTSVMCCNHCGLPDEEFWKRPIK